MVKRASLFLQKTEEQDNLMDTAPAGTGSGTNLFALPGQPENMSFTKLKLPRFGLKETGDGTLDGNGAATAGRSLNQQRPQEAPMRAPARRARPNARSPGTHARQPRHTCDEPVGM